MYPSQIVARSAKPRQFVSNVNNIRQTCSARWSTAGHVSDHLPKFGSVPRGPLPCDRDSRPLSQFALEARACIKVRNLKQNEAHINVG